MRNQSRSPRFARLRSVFARGDARSIRSSLALLVAICVLPGSLISVVLIVDDYKAHRDQVIHDTIATARAMASTLDRDLASIESGLHVLATSRLLASGDLAGFYRRAKAVLPTQDAAGYGLVDRSGSQRLNTSLRFGAALPVLAASPEAQQVFQTDATVVTDVFLGPLSGKPVTEIAVPVHRKGEIVWGLYVDVSLDRVATMLQRQRLPEGWIGVVFDRSGTVIARTQEMAQFVGKKVDPAIATATRQVAEGTFETVDPHGIALISAFSRSELSSWTVAIGIPESALTADLKRSLWLVIASTAALLAGGLWLAWYCGDRIEKSVRSLIAPAMALGCGNAITIPPLHLKEADEVARALVAASDMLIKTQHEAHYDALTGLANRSLFRQLLTQQLAICERDGSELSVLYIDLDGFKRINDVHGHLQGDELLRMAASRIRNALRGSDVAARFGGDEFVVLLVESNAESANTVAQKLLTLLSAPYRLNQLELRISASIGIAGFPHAAASSATLLERADGAMYEAKKSGKNRSVAALTAPPVTGRAPMALFGAY